MFVLIHRIVRVEPDFSTRPRTVKRRVILRIRTVEAQAGLVTIESHIDRAIVGFCFPMGDHVLPYFRTKISATLTGEGCADLCSEIWKYMVAHREAEPDDGSVDVRFDRDEAGLGLDGANPQDDPTLDGPWPGAEVGFDADDSVDQDEHGAPTGVDPKDPRFRRWD